MQPFVDQEIGTDKQTSSESPGLRRLRYYSRRRVMTRTKICFIVALLISTGITVSACGGSVHYTEAVNPEIKENHTGPPPHAPAHGYRHKHPDGEKLVYKSDIGVYVVVGYPDYYFHKNKYYRSNKGSWEVSFNIKRDWAPVSDKKLPSGLRKTKGCKKNK
jgi:hypothetical protein